MQVSCMCNASDDIWRNKLSAKSRFECIFSLLKPDPQRKPGKVRLSTVSEYTMDGVG